MRTLLALSATAILLTACVGGPYSKPPAVDTTALATVLEAQPEKVQARYDARNPDETLAFFGIAPGMKVAEALPGGGWYSKILIPYLGPEGELVGIDYSPDMWGEFSFATPEFIESKEGWAEEWSAKANDWVEGGAPVSALTFDGVGAPDGDMDAVLFIRALHNFNRFEDDGGYMTQAVELAHDMLKPGGVVGVVQHRAPETAPDAWADGSKGYLKQSAVIAKFEAAGFELVEASEINANPLDKPSAEDVVWRLPPSLNGVGDDEALKAKRMAIGESDRMTLKFRKI